VVLTVGVAPFDEKEVLGGLLLVEVGETGIQAVFAGDLGLVELEGDESH
jgi:hypothetical protein